MTRAFLTSDLAVCVELFVSTFAQPPWNETWERGVVRARLEQITRTPGAYGAVILKEGEIIGFALGVSEPWHEGSHFYLREMCVSHTHQRLGSGSCLLDYLASQLREKDTNRIYLLTARGDMSESFYAKAGFYTSHKMILMARCFE